MVKLERMRDKKRRTLTKALDGFEDYEINRAVSKIEIINCMQCGQPFVSENKDCIRRCDDCGPGDSYYVSYGIIPSRTRKRAHI